MEELLESLKKQLLGKSMELSEMNEICMETVGDRRLNILDESQMVWKENEFQGRFSYGLSKDEAYPLFMVEFDIVYNAIEPSETMIEVTDIMPIGTEKS